MTEAIRERVESILGVEFEKRSNWLVGQFEAIENQQGRRLGWQGKKMCLMRNR